MAPQSSSEVNKQNLRTLLALIIRDFDSHGGWFSNIGYSSPWLIATDFWSKRSGYSALQIKNMITNLRISDITGYEFKDRDREVFDGLKNAIQSWRNESGNQTPSVQLKADDIKTGNAKEIRKLLEKFSDRIPLNQKTIELEAGDVALSGFLTDRFNHRVSFNLTIKLRYGGKIWFSFRFPYYNLGDPSVLDQDHITGSSLVRRLGMPEVPELDLSIKSADSNHSRGLEVALGLVSSVKNYLTSEKRS